MVVPVALFRTLRVHVLFFGAITTFLLFVALNADGYFLSYTRYVYQFWYQQSHPPFNNITNVTYYETLDHLFSNSSSGTTIINGTTEVNFLLLKEIAPGSLHNSTFLYQIVPGVPAFAVVLIGGYFLFQLIWTLVELVTSLSIVGRNLGTALYVVFYSHGQGIIQNLLQFTFYVLVAFDDGVDLYIKFYAIVAMVYVFTIRHLYVVITKIVTEEVENLGDTDAVLIMPNGIMNFFSIIQVHLVVSKLAGKTHVHTIHTHQSYGSIIISHYISDLCVDHHLSACWERISPYYVCQRSAKPYMIARKNKQNCQNIIKK